MARRIGLVALGLAVLVAVVTWEEIDPSGYFRAAAAVVATNLLLSARSA
jgi:hypothetical protein